MLNVGLRYKTKRKKANPKNFMHKDKGEASYFMDGKFILMYLLLNISAGNIGPHVYLTGLIILDCI